MSDNRPCREELFEWINVVSFAVDDVKLYLDTHPCDRDALEYFEEFKKQRVPLTIDTACTPAERWAWTDTPWPWQEGGC